MGFSSTIPGCWRPDSALAQQGEDSHAKTCPGTSAELGPGNLAASRGGPNPCGRSRGDRSEEQTDKGVLLRASSAEATLAGWCFPKSRGELTHTMNTVVERLGCRLLAASTAGALAELILTDHISSP